MVNTNGGIGVNIRVSGGSHRGDRKSMEDKSLVAYVPTNDLNDLLFAFIGIFDGHGGPESAIYTKCHLLEEIRHRPQFSSDKDEDILQAIREGFVQTHFNMWKRHSKWTRTISGFPNTSGTTSTVAFIKNRKLYIGHAGDSRLVLGYEKEGETSWQARNLTKDHKPDDPIEKDRINSNGGKIIVKSGIPRVVWERVRSDLPGVRRPGLIDEIPFLAVARSLGDFWSFAKSSNEYLVSPVPDVHVIPIDDSFRCLVLGSDGLWNIMSSEIAVMMVQLTENYNIENKTSTQDKLNPWKNPAGMLVTRAVKRWMGCKQRADNITTVVILFDTPGPSKTQIILDQDEAVLLTRENVKVGVNELKLFSPVKNVRGEDDSEVEKMVLTSTEDETIDKVELEQRITWLRRYIPEPPERELPKPTPAAISVSEELKSNDSSFRMVAVEEDIIEYEELTKERIRDDVDQNEDATKMPPKKKKCEQALLVV